MEPNNTDNAADTDVGLIAGLLSEHLSVIQERSETAVLDLSEQLAKIKASLSGIAEQADMDADLSTQIERLSGLLEILQFQDVIRQQISAVQVGLTILAHTRPPECEDEQSWLSENLKLLEDAYVTQQQWMAHERFFGSGAEHATERSVFF